MLVGLVSDSHDNEPLVRLAVAFFRAQKVDLVLHLGDVTTPETLALFEGLPVQAVKGNNDALLPALPDSWQSNLAGVDVFATHGHVKKRVERAIGMADVVLHGHTHRRRAERIGGTLVVNPGALFRADVKTLALLRLPDADVAFHEVGYDGVRALD